MGLSLGTGGVENERECWRLPINQIFNYWIYDRKHVASILSSSFLAMSVAQRVPSLHSPINHLGDPIRFTLFPLPAICSSYCCRCIPSHSCFFSCWQLTLILTCLCIHTCIQRPFVTEMELNRKWTVLPYKVDANCLHIPLITAEKLWMQTCHAVSCWYIANFTNYYYANKRIAKTAGLEKSCWEQVPL